MRIGSAWTKTSEKDKKTFISVALDETVLELFPQLKECNISLSYISPEDRTSDKAPGWYVNLSKKKDKTEKNQQETTEASKEEAAIASDEEIPF